MCSSTQVLNSYQSQSHSCVVASIRAVMDVTPTLYNSNRNLYLDLYPLSTSLLVSSISSGMPFNNQQTCRKSCTSIASHQSESLLAFTAADRLVHVVNFA